MRILLEVIMLFILWWELPDFLNLFFKTVFNKISVLLSLNLSAFYQSCCWVSSQEKKISWNFKESLWEIYGKRVFFQHFIVCKKLVENRPWTDPLKLLFSISILIYEVIKINNLHFKLCTLFHCLSCKDFWCNLSISEEFAVRLGCKSLLDFLYYGPSKSCTKSLSNFLCTEMFFWERYWCWVEECFLRESWHSILWEVYVKNIEFILFRNWKIEHIPMAN